MTSPFALPLAAFAGDLRLAAGTAEEVARAAKRAADAGEPVLVFDADARPVDLDLRGTAEEVLARLPREAPRGPGRPKLGVTAREVTLLPRHWEWLARQPGGASVALRKLVEEASKSAREETRRAQEVAYRFMSAMAGDRPGFEEASRALFAGDRARFEAETAAWPEDIRTHLEALAAGAFAPAA
jgi:hypothetical protein